MKSADFERILSSAGFALLRVGKHRVWGRGTQRVAVPTKEINVMIARRELKKIGYSGRVEALNFG